MPKGGLRLEHIKPKDFIHEAVFGASDKTVLIEPLNRDISGVPVVYQGELPFCVAATITWIRQWQAKEHPDLAHEYLAQIAEIGDHGAAPSQVLEPARKQGICTQDIFNIGSAAQAEVAAEFKIGGYTRVTDLSSYGLYAALKKSPLAIGVKNFKGVGPHFLGAVDVTADGLALKCVNWWSPDTTLIEEVPFGDVVMAYSFLPPGFEAPVHDIRAGLATSMGSFVSLYRAIIAIIAVLGSIGGVFAAGYTPVTGYESRTTARIAAGSTTIPVASVSDPAGNVIDIGAISPSSTPRIYFNVEPGGSRQELFYCTGKSSLTWTGCVGGLPFQGGSLVSSSSLQFAHPAGSKIIMTNIGQFFTEYVTTQGSSTIYGVKTFDSFPVASNTTAIPSSNGQLVTKYYVDNVLTTGFSVSNVSSTGGLITSSAGAGPCPGTALCVAINLSATSSGLTFDQTFGGKLTVNASSTGGVVIDSNGKVAVDTTDNFAWSGTHTFSGSVTFSGSISFPLVTSSTVVDASAVTFASLEQFMATGTAGTSITAGQAVSISSTGTLVLASARQSTSTYNFVGIAQSAANVGQVVLYVRPGGIARGLSLTSGAYTYLGNTAGGVSSTIPGTVPAMLGIALTSSTLQLQTPNFYAHASGTTDFSTTPRVVLGWTPNVIIIPHASTTVTFTANSDGSMTRVLGGASFCGLTENVTSTQGGFAYQSGSCSMGSQTWIAEYTLPGIIPTY